MKRVGFALILVVLITLGSSFLVESADVYSKFMSKFGGDLTVANIEQILAQLISQKVRS
jgi:hypothetical protein